MNVVPQTSDALGGGGNLAANLRGIIVGGLSRAIDGELSKKYPLTSFNERETVGAGGAVRPASAPASPGSAFDAVKGALQNPMVIGIGVAIVASLALFIALRK